GSDRPSPSHHAARYDAVRASERRALHSRPNVDGAGARRARPDPGSAGDVSHRAPARVSPDAHRFRGGLVRPRSIRGRRRLRRALFLLAGAIAALGAIFSLPGLRQLVRRAPVRQLQPPADVAAAPDLPTTRDEIATLYRDIDHPVPPAARQVIAPSPISAAIATALASGV